MPDPRYWPYKLANPDDTGVTITEGGKKTLAGLTCDITTIGVLGVTMWHLPGQPDKLVPELEAVARKGARINLAFDSDWHTKPEVRHQLLKLGKAFKKRGCEVYVVEWDEYKGMDDYISAKGGDAFKERIADAKRIEEWERQFKKNPTGSQKAPPKADTVGAELAEKYRDTLVYCVEFQSWLEYGRKKAGVWAMVHNDVVDSIVHGQLKAMGVSEIGAIKAFHANVVHAMKCELLREEWEQPAHLIPFDDCVYDRAEKKTYEHSPGFGLLWKLPHRYRSAGPEMGFPTIDRFLSEATGGNQEHRQILIHFAAAVLRGRPDLQKFLMLIGPGGTGKDSYTNLLESLVGRENSISLTLEELDDKHERAALMEKRFALFADQCKAPKKLDMFKRLTGQSPMRGRKLFKDGSNFRFMGMAVVTANYPIFYGDSSSAIARRMILVPFDHAPAAPQDLQKLFQPELGAFTQYLLSISEDDITAILRPSGAALSRTAWASFIRSDSMAGWINEWVEYDPRAWTPVGGNQAEWRDKDYIPVQSSLYGSYSEWCRRNVGYLPPKAKNNFRADLVELCRQVLKWDGVKEKRTNAGMGIQGLRLKRDTGGVTLLEKFCADLGLHGADFSVDLKPLPGMACVDRVDLNSDLQDEKNNEPPQETPQEGEKATQGLHEPGNPHTEGGSGMHGAAPSVDLEVCTQGDSEDGPAASAPEPALPPPAELDAAEIAKWVACLQAADSPEFIEAIVQDAKTVFGPNYGPAKTQAWKLLTPATKDRIRQLMPAPAPAPVSEPAVPAPAPEPLITEAEAATLLTVAKNCLPDAAAGPSLLALAKELRLEPSRDIWQALTEACGKPVEVPAKEHYSYRYFPHADPRAKEETRRSQARQGLNQLLKAIKAKDFSALAAAFRRLNSAQLAWVAGNLLTPEIRQSLWEMVRTWCLSKINPQLGMF
jgi:putative DNA primase/helicase